MDWEKIKQEYSLVNELLYDWLLENSIPCIFKPIPIGEHAGEIELLESLFIRYL